MRVIYLITSMALFSCTTINEYPTNWAQIRNADTQCPTLSGYYEEVGEFHQYNQRTIYDCTLLSWQLLSQFIAGSIKQRQNEEIINLNQHCDTVANNHTQLQQFITQVIEPDNHQLHIKVWGIQQNKKNLLHDEMLNKNNGDYICDDNFLILKKRTSSTGFEARSFGRGDDDSIILKSDNKSLGSRKVTWYRWKPVAQ